MWSTDATVPTCWCVGLDELGVVDGRRGVHVLNPSDVTDAPLPGWGGLPVRTGAVAPVQLRGECTGPKTLFPPAPRGLWELPLLP